MTYTDHESRGYIAQEAVKWHKADAETGWRGNRREKLNPDSTQSMAIESQQRIKGTSMEVWYAYEERWWKTEGIRSMNCGMKKSTKQREEAVYLRAAGRDACNIHLWWKERCIQRRSFQTDSRKYAERFGKSDVAVLIFMTKFNYRPQPSVSRHWKRKEAALVCSLLYPWASYCNQ